MRRNRDDPLTVTTRGQVTFRREVLQHPGIQAGEKIALVLLPGRRAEIKAVQPDGTIRDFIGALARRNKKIATPRRFRQAL
ncbi:MAG TPA: AbrB/MazE/SpoVT family DNA-binding domain-containing protein [Rudaea sp.]|nr:AbrB/MazE/SpoVT family DNA-binding domain-containing protein [Rudaea sp.]